MPMMHNTQKHVSLMTMLTFSLTSLLPGLYFGYRKHYSWAVVHIGILAALIWLGCWAILLFDLLFWPVMAAALLLYWLAGLGIWKITAAKQSQKASGISIGIFVLVDLLLLSLIALIGGKIILDIRKVMSESMAPVIQEDQYLLIDRFAYRRNSPQRRDVVIFPAPAENEQQTEKDAVKRIAAVGGDRIYWKQNQMYINDKLYPKSDIQIREHEQINHVLARRLYSQYSENNPLVVPDGHLYMIGDNYDNSVDSRHYGTVKADSVFGKATQTIWPRQSAHLIR